MQYKIVVDKQPSTNPSDEKKEYVIDIEELRRLGDVYDTLNIELTRTYVTRRLQLSPYGILSVLDEPVTEELPEVDIELFEGDNYIYISDMQGNHFYAEYLVKNDFTDTFVTINQMNSAITQSAQSIELSVSQTLQSYATNDDLEGAVTELNSTISQTASEINLEVSKKVGDDEVISKINQSAEQVQINANKISLEGKTINLTSDDIVISSNNFNVTKNGNITANNAVFNNMSCNNGNIVGGSIILEDDNNANFTINGSVSGWGSFQLYAYSHAIMIQQGNDSFLSLGMTKVGNYLMGYLRVNSQNGQNTTIRADRIDTPALNQTSSEKAKKNIKKYTEKAIEKIKNSDIYSYNLKFEEDTDKKHIGFVIGNKYKTPKEVISKEGNAVELYSAIGILWKAVQEQQEQIEQLQERLKKLEEKEEANG